ncbi:hypothetical protein JOC70_001990 [Clostridium pascui]|uniref:zinc dependent phospholipase C family protein n=1 Tax=Clostridium pascui TaxID=46609 RepID=UPI00195A4755|nr:zinc dependent phospholipase C family protein [Clostridium pascui]MBM7870505.1 hypothetical protein [Clostridium pascui]
MPDAWTHILCAEDVISRISDEMYINILKNNKELYYFGAQGPDPLLYCNFYNPYKRKFMKKLSQVLHTAKTSEFLIFLIESLKESNDSREFEKVFAYVSGFITHYALDTLGHPFIYYFGGVYDPKYSSTKKYDTYHKELEVIIGTIEVKNRWGKDAYNTPIFKQIEIRGVMPHCVNQLVRKGFWEVHKISVEENLIENSYKDMKKSLKYMMDENGWKRKVLYVGEKIFCKKFKVKASIYPKYVNGTLDYLNKQHSRWNHPCNLNEVYYSDFDEIYEGAVKECSKMICSVIDYLNCKISVNEIKNVFPDKSYETGKTLENYSKMRYYKCIFEKNVEN